MDETLSNRELGTLKAAAQRLEPILKLGRAGMTSEFLRSVDAALHSHELVKIKLDAFKEQRKTLAPQLAEKTNSHLVTLVGHVVVLYRRKPAPTETAGAPKR